MDIQKIRSYLKGLDAGTLQPEEEAWIIRFVENATKEEWAAVFPDHEWDSLEEVPVDRQRLDHVYRNIMPVAQVVPMKPWWQRAWVKAAGAAAILVAGAVGFQLSRQHAPHQQEAMAIAWKTVTTAAGQRIVIHLRDSSDIYVNGGSTVMYPETFAQNSREIKLLEGEAFLDVAQDPQRPFVISTGDIHVNVLGTSFNVRNYSHENAVDVAVKTGRVAINNGKAESVLLSPGKKAVFSKRSGEATLADVRTTMVDGWISNNLVFTDMKLEDVFKSLRYNYGLHFKIENSAVLNKHIRGAFHRKSKEEIIHLLSKMARFNYRIKDSLVIIQ
ncbi:FecR family protein [Chitinophaga cymbidii]|uniref:Anti-sigma factor n=1 Tax=Chitinophaga cymbidii TaxID=1096750 RepID=A0A512REY3_9BACT|nr:FecR family protein [Chitinophaga cymbidii]GEP94265.1 hypothetical protein CCY01nite_05250 [Chitinophaga cymbidii]